jgi:hypothetical protein
MDITHNQDETAWSGIARRIVTGQDHVDGFPFDLAVVKNRQNERNK